jgi:hypothetical protein
MAAGTWKVFNKAKKNLGLGSFQMGSTATAVYKMCLCTSAAAVRLSANNVISTWASMTGEISARGGYAAAGRNLVSAKGVWLSVSAKCWKFSYASAGLVFTASGSALNNIKFAIIRNSTGAGAGKVLCYVTLSTAQFTISSPNTLTVLPASGGVFQLS